MLRRVGIAVVAMGVGLLGLEWASGHWILGPLFLLVGGGLWCVGEGLVLIGRDLVAAWPLRRSETDAELRDKWWGPG